MYKMSRLYRNNAPLLGLLLFAILLAGYFCYKQASGDGWLLSDARAFVPLAVFSDIDSEQTDKSTALNISDATQIPDYEFSSDPSIHSRHVAVSSLLSGDVKRKVLSIFPDSDNSDSG